LNAAVCHELRLHHGSSPGEKLASVLTVMAVGKHQGLMAFVEKSWFLSICESCWAAHSREQLVSLRRARERENKRGRTRQNPRIFCKLILDVTLLLLTYSVLLK
jgi:hypothetical protein